MKALCDRGDRAMKDRGNARTRIKLLFPSSIKSPGVWLLALFARHFVESAARRPPFCAPALSGRALLWGRRKKGERTLLLTQRRASPPPLPLQSSLTSRLCITLWLRASFRGASAGGERAGKASWFSFFLCLVFCSGIASGRRAPGCKL